jgi:hypothetical protein
MKKFIVLNYTVTLTRTTMEMLEQYLNDGWQIEHSCPAGEYAVFILSKEE